MTKIDVISVICQTAITVTLVAGWTSLGAWTDVTEKEIYLLSGGRDRPALDGWRETTIQIMWEENKGYLDWALKGLGSLSQWIIGDGLQIKKEQIYISVGSNEHEGFLFFISIGFVRCLCSSPLSFSKSFYCISEKQENKWSPLKTDRQTNKQTNKNE